MQRLAIFVLAALVAVGCGGGDNGPPGSTRLPGSSTTTAPTTSTTTVESAVEEAYLAYWEMGERLLQDPDPDDPEILSRTTGRLRAEMIESLTTLRAQGRRVRYGPRYGHHVLSVSVESDVAEVVDCLVDDGEVIDVRTERRVSGGLLTVRHRTTMVREAGAWKASEAAQDGTWEGVSRCDG
ncbi:MAG TPA: hypothetical protein VIL48_17895 [Acidimicrobiales bacterium]